MAVVSEHFPSGVWHNRAGTARATPQRFAAPQSEAELLAELRAAHAAGLRVRPVGAGHALTPLAAGEGLMLSLGALRGLVSRQDDGFTFWAGTTLGEARAALPPGLTLPGGAPEQSLGGALAVGAHSEGTPLWAALRGLTLLDVRGAAHELGPADPRLGAVALSLGALGVLTHVTVRPLPVSAVADPPPRTLPLAEARALAPEYTRRWPGLRLHWTQGELSVHTARQDQARRSRTGDAAPTPARAMEYALPLERLSGALRELDAALPPGMKLGLAVVGASGHAALPEQKPLTPPWLAPGGSGEHATVGLWPGALTRETGSRGLVQGEAVLRAAGGRPHWGRLHSLGATELAGLYPQFADFLRLRAHLDPEGRLSNAYLRRLLGT